MNSINTLIIGAGAAGMMAAAVAGQRGASVVLIDHSSKVGEKIRISGGGRCNFTNVALDGGDASRFFISQNPRFVRPALAHYTARDFVALLKKHRVPFHEKHKGQLFCDRSAQDVIDVLLAECAAGGVQWRTGCAVQSIAPLERGFEVSTSNAGVWRCAHLIIATGGLSIAAIGATGFGYDVARQFGHTITDLHAGLVPLTFGNWGQSGWSGLAGLALPVRVSAGVGKQTTHFDEDLLISHKGLTGPAILQISNYWQQGDAVTVNLCAEVDLAAALCGGKAGSKIQLDTALAHLAPNLPKRLLAHCFEQGEFAPLAKHKWADVPDKTLKALAASINAWTLRPSGSEGYKKAEVTRGGVAVKEVNPHTMESRLHKGLYFIGEVLDVTGWLGGYNFQWAWASGVAAGKAVSV
ncbi:MAG: NAD(P)/FAD-dependent oxidoreductase [Formosimonas sp.]